MLIGEPPLGVIDVRTRDNSAGRLRRPELTALVTLPLTELPVGANSTPFTRSGLDSIAENLVPGSVSPESSVSFSRTCSAVPAGKVYVVG